MFCAVEKPSLLVAINIRKITGGEVVTTILEAKHL